MNFHVLTLFPEMVMNGLNTSILGRAAAKGLLSFEAVNIRDYTLERHGKVDDYPYGGGAGMVMQAEPIYRAYEALSARFSARPRVIYMTPQGRVFTQQIAKELAAEEELVFLCGHYEGVDERALELIATDYLSAGDYVLTGGELPAMMMIDCISRLVPGVLNNDVSAEFESFHDNLLEYPQYTRPEEFMGRKVPEILLSGHHANIEKWRREQSIIRSLERRPKLLEEAVLSKKEREFLEKARKERQAEAVRTGCIRKLRETDLECVMRIWLEANKEAHFFIPADYWQENYETVQKLLPQAEVYVYENGSGRIEGFIGLADCCVAGIFVDKAARSAGIGKRLLEHAKGLRPELTLHVYRENERAVRFYLREGFRTQETLTDSDTGAVEFLMRWER